jgi:hypothetical protein
MSARRSLAWLGLGLVVACGQARGGDATRDPAPETSDAADPPGATGEAALGSMSTVAVPSAQSEPALYTCPAPGNDPIWATFRTEWWGRDPSTGDCCEYGALNEVPADWAAFETKAECQSDCRCQTIEPARLEEPGFSPGYAFESLECAKPDYKTAAGQMSDLCGLDYARIILSLGCGKIEISDGGGLSSRSWVFDAATGQQIGQIQAGDTLRLPCRTSVTISGVDFDCPEATRCTFCGVNVPNDARGCDSRERAALD